MDDTASVVDVRSNKGAVRPEHVCSHDTNVWMSPFHSGIRAGSRADSAVRSRSVHMIRQRHPSVAESLIRHPPRPSTVLRVWICWGTLDEAGLEIPSWRTLADAPPQREDGAEPAEPKVGWQHRSWPTLAAVSEWVWVLVRLDCPSPGPPKISLSFLPTQQTQNIDLVCVGCTSDLLPPNVAVRSIIPQEMIFVTRLFHSSSDPHQNLFWQDQTVAELQF